MNTKTKKIKSFVTKTEKPSQKIAQTTKLKILMPPFFLYNCLGFSDWKPHECFQQCYISLYILLRLRFALWALTLT